MIRRGAGKGRMGVALIAAFLALAACEPRPEWVQTGVGGEQKQRDVSYCNGAAELARSYSMNQRGANDLVMMDAFEKCMREKGYRPEARQRS